MASKDFNWDATAYFGRLTASNKLAQAQGFTFCSVSSLQGFEDALANMQESVSFVCVSDLSDGYTSLLNTPHTRRVKTVFLAMRHEIGNMQARESCMNTLRELFRQFMTDFLQEKVRLEEHFIYPDPRISFTEIDSYFFSGCACAYFKVAVDTYTDLRYDVNDWAE